MVNSLTPLCKRLCARFHPLSLIWLGIYEICIFQVENESKEVYQAPQPPILSHKHNHSC